MRIRQGALWYIVGALFVLCASVWSFAYAEAPHAPGTLTFAVLDVGQGDALYIDSPTGVQVLVDGGPGSALLRALPGVMPYGDRSLNAVVATHPDADHIGGLLDLLERYEVEAFISPGITKDTATAQELEERGDQKEIPRIVARRGMVLELGGGAQLRILYPDHDVSRLVSSKTNEGGVVMQLVYGQTEALLMADVGHGVEAHLLQTDGEMLESDILKVGHHGSKNSTGAAFVRAVSPAVAIISVGANNTYGHPTAEALGVLGRAGADILRTDQGGTVVCSSDGQRFSCE